MIPSRTERDGFLSATASAQNGALSYGAVERASCSSSEGSHEEPHFGMRGAEIVRDAIVGLADGLTVPFALAAGLAGVSTIGNSRLIVTAGVAEIIAGSISMGLGGYLAGLSEIEHYDSERAREKYEVENMPEREEEEINEIFEDYGVSRNAIQPIVQHLKANPHEWVDFMMKFELGLERPNPNRTWVSALTIGISYLLGGLVPLLPYVFVPNAQQALVVSCITTTVALLIFGYIKAAILGNPKKISSAIHMTLTGAMAGAAAYYIAGLVPQ